MTGQRLIVGISGASGVVYGVRILEVLRDVPDVETHLVMTSAAKLTLGYETHHAVGDVESLAVPGSRHSRSTTTSRKSSS